MDSSVTDVTDFPTLSIPEALVCSRLGGSWVREIKKTRTRI